MTGISDLNPELTKQDEPCIPEDLPDWDKDFIDEAQISLFALALEYEDETSLNSPYSTSSSLVDLQRDHQLRRQESIPTLLGGEVELIKSKHDWLPIYKRLKKRAKSDGATGIPNAEKLSFSIFFKLMRYPILIGIMSWVALLFIGYLLLRLYVSIYEYLFNWKGKKGKLRQKMRLSKSYQEWAHHAKELDSLLGLDKWRNEDKYFYYDYKTLRRIVKQLSTFRQENSPEETMSLLQNCLKENFAGTENPLLYSRTYFGTKRLIEIYNEEVVKSLNFIIETKDISNQDKKTFFKIVDKNFGKTALCLSGGATFAYNHFGIVKALIDNDLLPNIISGTSGGGLVAALACSRTNEELSKILNPRLAEKITACAEPFEVWYNRWRTTGARFDAVDWAKKSSWFTKGGLTYQEMYLQTGKKLNISTVPSDPHSPVILCNEITSPNCIVWSSLLLSSAVPGILNPVVLMMKDKSGKVIPFSFGNKWKDGSLRTDIPVEALNNYYNVKFSIVSQVNPHISLFFYAPKGSVGNPVTRRHTNGLRGGFLIASLEHLIKLEITKWFKLIKSLELLPRIKDQDWSNVWLQKFSGTITIWPKLKFKDLYYILSDPTETRLEEMLRNGENSAYPKLHFIQHRLNIERCIEHGREMTRSISVQESITSDDLQDSSHPEIVDGSALHQVPIFNLSDDYTTDDEDHLGSDTRRFKYFEESSGGEYEGDDDDDSESF